MDTYATRPMHALSTLELKGGPEHARAVTFATRTMYALSTLKLRGGPEHARAVCFTLIAPFIKHL